MSIKEKTNPGVIARIKKILVGDFVETGATASQNIGAGKFFVWRNKLKQAKSAISSGDTFTEGTNMEAVAEGALNALNSNVSMKNTTIKNQWVTGTGDITGIDCTGYRYVLLNFYGNDAHYRTFLFPVTSNSVSQEVRIDADSAIYLRLKFRLNFASNKISIDTLQIGTWSGFTLTVIGVE